MKPVDRPTGAPEGDSEDAGAALMARIRAGDQDAFAELVDRYQKVVLNAVFKFIGNRALAEELTQDVFVRIFRAAASYERLAKFDTWLYRIVFNLCANAAEYGRRRRALSLDRPAEAADEAAGRAAPEPPEPDGETPLERLERDETRHQVREAIGRLPPQQRAALIMSRYQNMPYEEVARALDTSVEAVKSLLFRARENLRERLAPYLRLPVAARARARSRTENGDER